MIQKIAPNIHSSAFSGNALANELMWFESALGAMLVTYKYNIERDYGGYYHLHLKIRNEHSTVKSFQADNDHIGEACKHILQLIGEWQQINYTSSKKAG